VEKIKPLLGCKWKTHDYINDDVLCITLKEAKEELKKSINVTKLIKETTFSPGNGKNTFYRIEKNAKI
jgi:hypothetical protein